VSYKSDVFDKINNNMTVNSFEQISETGCRLSTLCQDRL